MKEFKTIALCKDSNGKCVYVAEIKNVSLEEYKKLCDETLVNELAKAKEHRDLLAYIEKSNNDLLEKIKELEHEIKVLKGEE